MKISLSKKNKSFFVMPPLIKTPFLIVYLFTLISALTTLTFYFKTQPVVPIFYSLAEPTQHLAAKEWLFLFPLISMIISLLHTALIRLLNKSELLLLKLFAWTTVIIQTVLLLALLRIVYIIS
ncbi:MAG: hypothetical protein GW942_00725 [Candidatus Pacebacteria bacterium]|nr:hypothetical protein [Candidatus Paceibacterota bacterium]